MASNTSFSSTFATDIVDADPFSSRHDTGAPSSQALSHMKRRRATRACLGCRARKVRCNVTENGSPCTNCRLDKLDCVVRKRKRARPRQFRIHCFKQDPDHLSAPIQSVITIEDNRGPLDEEQVQNTIFTTSTVPMNQLDLPPPGCIEALSDSALCPRSPSELVQPLCDIPSGEVYRGAEHDSCYRVLSHATDLIATSPFKSPSIDISASGNISTDTLLPAYIKPLRKQVAKEDIEYLRQRGALTIPDPELRNALLQGFIEYVYCYMPMVDLQNFVEIISQGDGQNGQLSLLLFHAVMFAGSAFIDMGHLSKAGYATRRVAREALFRKVRLLYDFDAESCVISQIQSLLLMTYYFHRPNEQKDLWYWIGIVVSLAHTAGLHRDPTNESTSPIRDQHLRKRLWWSILMRDHMIALGMRRLPRIAKDDYNVPFLTLDDFDCDAISMELSVLAPSCMMARDIYQRRQLAIMCMEKAKLCILIGLILSSQYTVSQVGHAKTDLMLSPKRIHSTNQQARLCLQELGNWNAQLPRICVYDSSISLSRCEAPVMIVHKAILRMIYLTTLSAVYRPEVLPVCPWSTSTTSPLHPTATELIDPAQAAIRRAANEISCIAQDLQSLDLVRYLPTTVVTALLPAMLIHLLDLRSRSSQNHSLTPSFHPLGGCMHVMHLLHETYASADFAIEFIEDTARKGNVNVTFTILPRFTIPIPSSYAVSPETAICSDNSSPSSSLDSQNWAELKTANCERFDISADRNTCAGAENAGHEFADVNEESSIDPCCCNTADPLNFFNLTTNGFLNVSPVSSTPASMDRGQNQEVSNSIGPRNAVVHSSYLGGGEQNEDFADLYLDSNLDFGCHEIMEATNDSPYSHSRSVGHDSEFHDLFGKIA